MTEFIKLDGIQNMLESIAADLVTLAVMEAPTDTGDLRDSITAGAFNPVDNSIEVFVDPSKLGRDQKRQGVKPWNGIYYPEMIHEGTRAHEIKPKNGKALAWQTSQGVKQVKSGKRAGRFNKCNKNNTYAVVKSVHHPGTKANPFFTRAQERLNASEFASQITFKLLKTELN